MYDNTWDFVVDMKIAEFNDDFLEQLDDLVIRFKELGLSGDFEIKLKSEDFFKIFKNYNLRMAIYKDIKFSIAHDPAVYDERFVMDYAWENIEDSHLAGFIKGARWYHENGIL